MYYLQVLQLLKYLYINFYLVISILLQPIFHQVTTKNTKDFPQAFLQCEILLQNPQEYLQHSIIQNQFQNQIQYLDQILYILYYRLLLLILLQEIVHYKQKYHSILYHMQPKMYSHVPNQIQLKKISFQVFIPLTILKNKIFDMSYSPIIRRNMYIMSVSSSYIFTNFL